VSFLYAAAPTAATPSYTATFHLLSGGELRAEILASAKDAVVVNSQVGELTLPFAALQAIAFQRTDGPVSEAAGLIAAARAEGRAGQDVLVADDEGQAKAVRGTLVSLGNASSEFQFAGKSRRISTARIFGVVFAAGPAAGKCAPVTLRMRNGDALPGTLASGPQPEGRISVVLPFGKTLELPYENVESLEFHNPRIVHLSELTPQTVHSEGLVHEPWTWRRNRNVGNAPLAMGGRKFDHGIGVHARTELVYEIAGVYETFAAVIGIDDAVRPRGAVVFVVQADGKEVFTSGPLTGADRPREMTVPVAGARTLTLLVDYGPGVDLADWADWAGARLIKKK
jgi:hypothetical protein